MRKKAITIALGLLVLVLLAGNFKVASAHQWWAWHWGVGLWHFWERPSKNLGVWVYGSYSAESNAALNDWRSRLSGIFTFTSVGSHTDVSLYAGNYGATDWGGLASIENYDYDWWHGWCWCKITHAHARTNTYWWTGTGLQGVQCQEFGHTLGLDHSNTGDCMGKTYYNSINVTSSHNRSDISSMYP
ncbi:MAG: hypothetical protein AABZ64_11860 [Nitrospinota bacterium]